jgi:purine nucleosidase
LQPELFSGREVHVAIECESELTMGMTVVDWWGVTGKPPTALVIKDIDSEGFFDLLSDRIARLP